MECDPEQPEAARPAKKKPRKPRKPRPKRSKLPVQAALYQKWQKSVETLETALKETAKLRVTLSRGEQHSDDLACELVKVRFKKEREDDYNDARRAKLAQRKLREDKLRTQVTESREAWEAVPKMKKERSDGQPAASDVYLTMVFKQLWRPGTSRAALVPARMFQLCCWDWRLAARMHVSEHPYFRQPIPRCPWAQSCLITERSSNEGDCVFEIVFYEGKAHEDQPGQRRESHLVAVPKYRQRYDEFALVPVADDPTTCALVMQEVRAHDAVRLVSAGGYWTFNVAGDVCDWTKLPITILQVIQKGPLVPTGLTGRLVSLVEVRKGGPIRVRVPRIDMPRTCAAMDTETMKLAFVDKY